MPASDAKPLLAVLNGERRPSPPIWMMRQAGRYLPEYRAIREKAGSFLGLCYNPEMAAEVTIQPIRRFGFDGAILFSDILVVPHALGQRVTFETGEGPKLDPVSNRTALSSLSSSLDPKIVEPIYETVRRVKAMLPAETTFLGFCGAPWTVSTYMVAGRGGDEQVGALGFAGTDREGFAILIDRLIDTSITYLLGQIEAGVEVVQIFDTWAGALADEADFEAWCVAPIARMVAGVRQKSPKTPVIVFARGVGERLGRIVEATGCQAVGLDSAANPSYVRQEVQPRVAVQGNIDPEVLLAGGAALDRAVDAALEAFGHGRYIFNLGHGIVPPTPIAHVERMLNRVRAWSA